MPLLTIVFTDVVESSATKRDVSLGRDNRERDQAYLEKVQTRHFDLVRARCQAHGGKEVGTMGDAFYLAFEDPVEAIRCAVDIQQHLAAAPIETPRGALRIRIGIHSGFPEAFEGGWQGTDVDTAARVVSVASERQILLSSRTYELIRHMTDVHFRCIGQFALKGVDRITLWEADWDNKGPRHTAVPPLEVGLRRKRNLRILSAVTAALLLIGVGALWYRYYQTTHTLFPTKPRPSVAVMGFKNSGKPEVDWLSNALSEMLTTELGASGSIRTVSPEDVAITKADLGISLASSFDFAALSRIRRILHSEYLVSGSYVAMGNQPGDIVRVDVRIQDAHTGETISSFAEEGTIATLSDLLRKVAADLRSRMGVPNPSPGVRTPTKTALPSDPEALRLYTQGLAKLRLFDALGARDQLEKSIALEPNFALPHFALARTWQILGYDAKARDEAKKAVELSGDLPPQEKRSIEAQYRELNGEWGKAAAIYDALWVLYPDEPNYALSLSNTQISDGKAQVALETLQTLSKQPDMKDDPRVDLSVALAAESLSDIPKQRDAAASSAEKAKRQGSRLLAAHAYWQLCSAYYALGEYEKGEQACNDSTRSAPFDDEIKARSQTVWASIMEAQGNTSQALEMRRQALETAQKIGSQKDIVGALQNLADLLDVQGGGEDAQKYYEEALQIARAIDDKSGTVKGLNSLAAHRNSLGDFVGAEALYLQSLETAREINDSGMTATVLLNLGMLQSQLGKLDEAQKNTQQAIALYREAGMEIYMPAAMNVVGDLYTDRGEMFAARKSYEESLDLSVKQKSASAIAASRAAIAAFDLEDEKAAEAEPLARQAADEFASEKLVDNEADARSSLARSLLAQGKLSEARAEADRALRLKPRDRTIALGLSITDARVKSGEGKTSEASKILETSLAEATKSKLVGSALQIKFCQAEMEIQENRKSALSLFAALEKDAVAKGYLLIASQAQLRVKQLSKT